MLGRMGRTCLEVTLWELGRREAAVPFLICPDALPGPSFLVLPSCQIVKLPAHASLTDNNNITVTVFIN